METMRVPEIITPALLDAIRAQYRLNWDGIHGFEHWLRVYENGQRLAEVTGADAHVVTLFAFTHDMARHSDGFDPLHGPRAAKLIAASLQESHFRLAPERLKTLLAAVHGHTTGRRHGDVTVLTCWDADRLDLGRAGIRPNPALLCTPAARDPGIIAWALERSTRGE